MSVLFDVIKEVNDKNRDRMERSDAHKEEFQKSIGILDSCRSVRDYPHFEDFADDCSDKFSSRKEMEEYWEKFW